MVLSDYIIQKTKETIRKANESDWKQLLNIYQSCANWLSSRGYDHWQGAYNEEKVKKRLKEMEVYFLYEKEIPVGTVSLSAKPAGYYKESYHGFWEDKSAKAIYIRGLAVLPSHHSKGFAVQLMDFAEKHIKESGIHYIRFDALRADDKLTQFYLNRHYKLVGQSEDHNFYEKLV
ncbi:MAG: GNAT family N-acetyltransferase [Candidatus Micrarchaeaceae archaeon]